MNVTKIERLTDGSAIVTMELDHQAKALSGDILFDVDGAVVDHFLGETGFNRELSIDIARAAVEDLATYC